MVRPTLKLRSESVALRWQWPKLRSRRWLRWAPQKSICRSSKASIFHKRTKTLRSLRRPAAHRRKTRVLIRPRSLRRLSRRLHQCLTDAQRKTCAKSVNFMMANRCTASSIRTSSRKLWVVPWEALSMLRTLIKGSSKAVVPVLRVRMTWPHCLRLKLKCLALMLRAASTGLLRAAYRVAVAATSRKARSLYLLLLLQAHCLNRRACSIRSSRVRALVKPARMSTSSIKTISVANESAKKNLQRRLRRRLQTLSALEQAVAKFCLTKKKSKVRDLISRPISRILN